MKFIRRGAGRMDATSPAGDRIEIVKDGFWKLTIYEADTGAVMHTASAGKQVSLCREACRFFGVGAYGDPKQMPDAMEFTVWGKMHTSPGKWTHHSDHIEESVAEATAHDLYCYTGGEWLDTMVLPFGKPP